MQVSEHRWMQTPVVSHTRHDRKGGCGGGTGTGNPAGRLRAGVPPDWPCSLSCWVTYLTPSQRGSGDNKVPLQSVPRQLSGLDGVACVCRSALTTPGEDKVRAVCPTLEPGGEPVRELGSTRPSGCRARQYGAEAAGGKPAQSA